MYVAEIQITFMVCLIFPLLLNSFLHKFTVNEGGYIEQLEGLFSVQFVGSLFMLGIGTTPVHPALAKSLDEHPIWCHP